MKLHLHASWNEVKDKLKENDYRITDEDLEFPEGKEEILLDKLAKKLNRTKDEVRVLIESISSNKGKAA